MRRHHAPALLALAAAAAHFSCSTSVGPGRGFEIEYPDNRADQIGQIANTIANGNTQTPTPALVVLTPPSPARGLAVYSLPDGQRLWQVGARIDARPLVLGDLVLGHTEGAVVAWDAQSGRERWRLGDQHYGFVGAGRDGNNVAISLGPGGLTHREGAFYVVDAQSGGARFERHVEQALGSPTVAGNYAFVPWNGQYLTIVDINGGDERARIRSTDDVFSRATHEGGAVYFGARALYRLSSEAGGGRREGSGAMALPREDLPGNPVLLGDGYAIAPAGVNARERVAVVFRPDPAQAGVHPVDNAMYSLFHRAVFAIEAASPGAVRWAHLHAHDIAGAYPVRGGLVLVDDQGEASMLDTQHGNVVWHAALGAQAAQASFQLPLDFAPPRSGEEPVQAPAETLLTAAGGTDNRLLPARIFAVRALGGLTGPEATRALLEVAGRRNYPQELRAAAGEALGRRTDGIDALIDALDHHYDFVRGVLAPPVGFIARAIATAHDRRGVAPLIAHLQDHETPVTELPPLVSALRDLGDAAAVPALLDFLRLYHADEGVVPPVSGGDAINDRTIPEQEAITSAMEMAIGAIAQLGGARERRWLEWMQRDRNTLPTVRSAIEAALAEGGDQPATGAQSGGGGGGGGGAGSSGGGGNSGGGSAPVGDVLPARVSREMMDQAFGAVRDRMMACLAALPSRPAQVRIQFWYDSTGAVTNVSAMPAPLTACIAPIASGVHLPESQTSREIGTWYLLGGVQ